MTLKLTSPTRQLPSQSNKSHATIRAFIALLVLALLWQLWSFSQRVSPAIDPSAAAATPTPSLQNPSSASPATSAYNVDPQCANPIPGMQDVFVILKTGIAEHETRLPVHFNTTLRCVPRYGIFSDYPENVEGHAIDDALEDVDEALKFTQQDFEMYNRLQRGGGRDALSREELEAASPKTSQAKKDGPGWRLDKWKMVPLVDRALRAAPDAKWFIFVEPDTYVLWPNLVEWLKRFDHRAPWYLGEPEQVGAEVVAHGGAGVVLSAEAMRRVSEFRRDNSDKVEELTASQPIGGSVLGKVLAEVGVPLTWAWPNLQSGRPTELDWGEEREEFGRLWCHRAVSYHGLSNEEIEYMYAAEQDAASSGTPLTHHRHVFQDFIMSQVSSTKPRWDNLADRKTFRKLTKKGLKMGKPVRTYSDCRLECDQYGSCIGFSWIGKQCRFNTKFQLGQRNETGGRGGKELTSGFMTDRVDWMVRWLEDEPCKEREQWVLPIPVKDDDEEDD